ncbi:MAG: hypothetical protein V7700_16455 [Halioglobus sp.]
MYETIDKGLVFGCWAISLLYIFSLLYKPFGLQVRRRQALLKQAWFVVGPLVFIGLHLSFMDELTEVENNIAVTAAQLVGVGIVIISIANTLGLFDGRSTWHRIKSWVSEFFRIGGRNYDLNVEGGAFSSSFVGHPTLISTSDNTLEGRIKALEEKLDFFAKQLKEQINTISDRFTKENQQLKQGLTSLSQQVSNFERNFTTATVSGLNSQIFGFILLAYGTIADRFLLPY